MCTHAHTTTCTLFPLYPPLGMGDNVHVVYACIHTHNHLIRGSWTPYLGVMRGQPPLPRVQNRAKYSYLAPIWDPFGGVFDPLKGVNHPLPTGGWLRGDTRGGAGPCTLSCIPWAKALDPHIQGSRPPHTPGSSPGTSRSRGTTLPRPPGRAKMVPFWGPEGVQIPPNLGLFSPIWGLSSLL